MKLPGQRLSLLAVFVQLKQPPLVVFVDLQHLYNLLPVQSDWLLDKPYRFQIQDFWQRHQSFFGQQHFYNLLPVLRHLLVVVPVVRQLVLWQYVVGLPHVQQLLYPTLPVVLLGHVVRWPTDLQLIWLIHDLR